MGYNACAVTAMAVAHSRMLVDPDEYGKPVNILVDNTSTKAMTQNDKDTKRTRHIATRMHFVGNGQQKGAHNLVVFIWNEKHSVGPLTLPLPFVRLPNSLLIDLVLWMLNQMLIFQRFV